MNSGACVLAVLALFVMLSIVCLKFSSAIAAETSTQPAIAFAAKIVGDESRARIIVDFDKKVRHKSYLLADPTRMIIDLPETLFNLGDGERIQSHSLITELRTGRIAEGQSRMILSLSDTVSVEKQSFKKVAESNTYRLIVDVVKTAPELFAAALQKQTKLEPKPKIKKPSAKQFKIVIDAGHGGIDGGAVGTARTVEKSVTLSFVLKLRDILEKNPAFHVILTRDDDTFLGLRDRVGIARRNKADLMISVHADSLQQRDIRGATVYTLSEEGSDEISRSLARKQNRADLVAGLKLPDVEAKVADILIDLTRRETAVFSNRFANTLVEKLKDGVQLIRNPHRSADFFVLKAPEIPSILLELGYLSNSQDEKLMRTESWQLKAAEQTKRAIEAFFAPRLAKQ